MLLWIWIFVIIASAIFWLKHRYSYFHKRGLKTPPIVPLLGTLTDSVLRRKHISTVSKNIYDSFPNERFVGTFETTLPVLYVRDPELLRKIGVKDFEYFANHRSFGNDNDPLFSKSLFGLKDQKWREMRTTLSPAFTGSKLRNMVPLMLDCNGVFVKHLQKQVNDNGGVVDVDTHDLITRYTNDVIATCVFGLQSNSFENKDNVIYKMADKLTSFNAIQVFKFFLLMAFPFIKKLINIEVFSKASLDFFGGIVLNTMKNREENNSFRPDIIQILLEARKGTLKHEHVEEKESGFASVQESTAGKGEVKQTWNDSELVAQAFIFYFAGFDTVSTCMKLLFLELALNPDIQDRLRQEVDEHFETHKGKLDYETINKIKYLDMVVSETLRKWPPILNNDRICTKQYNIGKPNNEASKDFIVEKGLVIHLPIYPIHRDPKFYENPEKFDPERFSDENKHKINQFTYMPFGIGPRNCIGSRFALVEVKTMTYEVIRHFELSPAPQTTVPPRFHTKNFSVRLEGGHWLRFKNRTK